MNVLMFGWEFPPNISGGLGTACKGIISGLCVYPDIKVTFVVPKIFGTEESCENLRLVSAEQIAVADQVETIEFQERFQEIDVSSGLSPYLNPETYLKRIAKITRRKEQASPEKEKLVSFSGKYGPSLFDEVKNYAAVARKIAETANFEVIHAHDWLTFPAAIEAKRISGKPLILHIHSTDFDRSGGSANPTIYNIEKEGMKAADRIITVSNLIKRRLTDQYQIAENKITTVYNAVASSPEAENSNAKRRRKKKLVTFLGRLTVQKGPEYFINVARMVIHKMPDVRFVIAGSGEMKPRLVELCARYGLGNKLHFAGFLNCCEVESLLQQSDLVIMPSVSEPFGIVPLEAMKAGVPVIISKQSGVAEVIEHAIKTDFWDIHAMADAVHGILKHRKLHKILAKEGCAEVNRYRWEHVAGKIREIYIRTARKSA